MEVLFNKRPNKKGLFAKYTQSNSKKSCLNHSCKDCKLFDYRRPKSRMCELIDVIPFFCKEGFSSRHTRRKYKSCFRYDNEDGIPEVWSF